MELSIHMLIHLSFSLLAGFIVWMIWKKPVGAFVSAVVGGVLVDLDHLVDYWLAFGFNFNFDYFAKGYEFIESGKIYVFLHGWEYVVVLILLALILKSKTAKTIFLALALGLLFHLTVDVVTNNTAPKTYSIIHRIQNNFERDSLKSGLDRH